MSKRKVPTDAEMRVLLGEHPHRVDAKWAELWGCSKSAVALHRARLNIPNVRERRAILEGRA